MGDWVLLKNPFSSELVTYSNSSSETQGQIVGAKESLNGRKYMARRKVKNGEKIHALQRSIKFSITTFSSVVRLETNRVIKSKAEQS